MRLAPALLIMPVLMLSPVYASEAFQWSKVDDAWCVEDGWQQYCLPEAAYPTSISTEGVSFRYKTHEQEIESFIESFYVSSGFGMSEASSADSGVIGLAYLGTLTVHAKRVEEYETPYTSVLQVQIGSDVVVQVHSGSRSTALHVMETLLVAKSRGMAPPAKARCEEYFAPGCKRAPE